MILINGLAINEGTNHVIGCCLKSYALAGVFILLKDKEGYATRQFGILAYLVGVPSYSNNRHYSAFIIERGIDTRLCSCIVIFSIYFQRLSGVSNPLTYLMVIAYSAYVSAGKYEAVRVYEVNIVSTEFFYRIYDTLSYFFAYPYIH